MNKACSLSCRGHVTHPCERCGLQWSPITPQERQQIADLKAQVVHLQDCKRKNESDILIEAHENDTLKAQVAELEAYKHDNETMIDWASRIILPEPRIKTVGEVNEAQAELDEIYRHHGIPTYAELKEQSND